MLRVCLAKSSFVTQELFSLIDIKCTCTSNCTISLILELRAYRVYIPTSRMTLEASPNPFQLKVHVYALLDSSHDLVAESIATDRRSWRCVYM